jgi:hypothetical protein
MSKFKELTDLYMENKDQDLSQEEWELIEEMSKKRIPDKNAIDIFESVFCDISELEVNE